LIEAENLGRLRVLMQFGGGAVLDISFSQDGSLLGVETTAGRILFEAGTLERRQYGENVWEAAFGPTPEGLQGVQLIDGVYVENAYDQTLVSQLEGAVSLPETFSADFELAAGFLDTERIGIWETASGMLLRTLDTRQAQEASRCADLMDPAFSPDGSFLAAGCRQRGTGYIWRIQDAILVHVLETELDQLGGLAFSRDSRLLAASLPGNRIQLWRVRDGTLQHILAGANGSRNTAVGRTAFSPDGYYLVGGFSNGELLVWRLSDASLLRILQGPGFFAAHPGEGVAVSPDGSRIVHASWNQVVVRSALDGQILNVITADYDTADPTQTREQPGGFVRSLAVSADSRTLAVIYDQEEPVVELFRLADGIPVGQIALTQPPVVVRSAQLADVLAVGTDSGVYLYDSNGQPLPGGYIPPESERDILVNMAIASDGALVAISRSESGVRVWDWRDSGLIAELSQQPVERLLFSPGGSWLAASQAGQLMIFAGDTWETVYQAAGTGLELAFSPAGTLLLTSNPVGQIQAVNLDGLGGQIPVVDNPAALSSLVFHPAGRWFAAASLDGSIRIFGPE
jgi:WD40 repeat protein